MPLQEILTRIDKETQAQVESINQEAEKEAQATLNEAQKKLAQEKEKAEQLAQQEAEREKRKLLTEARLSMRDKELALKRELLEQVFQKATDKVAQLPEEKLKSIFFNLIKNSGARGNIEIIASEKHRDIFSDDFIAQLKQTLNSDIKLSGEPAKNIIDGFILRFGKIENNFSLKTLLREEWEQKEAEIARILFEEG